MIQNLAQYSNIRVALVVGGLSLQSQASVLRSQPEIIVATPGRMIDHLRNSQSVCIEDLQALVFDEADKLLQMGFKDEIEEIIRLTPKLRQTMLFSATMTAEVKHGVDVLCQVLRVWVAICLLYGMYIRVCATVEPVVYALIQHYGCTKLSPCSTAWAQLSALMEHTIPTKVRVDPMAFVVGEVSYVAFPEKSSSISCRSIWKSTKEPCTRSGTS